MGKTSACFIKRISYLSTVFFRISSIIPAPTSYWSLFSTFGNMFNSHTLASQQDGAKVWQLDMCEHVQTGWCFRFLVCTLNGTISFKLCFFVRLSCDNMQICRLASGSVIVSCRPKSTPQFSSPKFRCKIKVLLMEEILHQFIGSLSHYLQGFLHPRWCRISSTNSISDGNPSTAGLLLDHMLHQKFRCSLG